MWVFTKDGFFSAVFDRHCTRDELAIRARCRDDLCRLAKRLYGYCDESQVSECENEDYQFRMKIPKHLWSEYLSQCAVEVNYPNVRDHLIPEGDRLREDAYYKVWVALYRWQSLT